MAGSPVTDDRLSAVLGKSRRRLALYYLLSNEYTDIDSLSVQLAAWERDESVTSVDEAARRQVKISLHHNHLPRLEQHGVLEFDVRSGDVVRSPGFEDLRPAVERLRATDEKLDRLRNDRGVSGDVDGEQFAFTR
ncbi:hypothetical protein OB920_16885 [Halobacteria archaeon HArc-gm2]|nr:hypothetical protein [Halobacteria archaeon HArc-gm2]